MKNIHTPIKSFIEYKSETAMQCGNYGIEIPPLKEGEQYRFHFDTVACVGCHCCEVACNEQNGNSANIKWRRVGELEGGIFPNSLQQFNSMSCNHCIDPACLKGCPTESYIKFDNGIVFHNDDSCIGCQYCTWNCPYEVPVFNPERKIVTKCHMCHERLELNQTPACVQACPSGAIEIEVVNKDEWIKNDIQKEGIAPHLPDINITKPTTRYTIKENLPKLKPADSHITKPAHSELPLVFMTVLTQISFGGFLALFLGQLLSFIGLNLASPNIYMLVAIALPAMIGLPFSALHLGRPILAHTAMKNIKTSWLSREALSLGIYVKLLILLGILFFFDIDDFFKLNLEIIILIVGGYGIYSQSMIYRIASRPSWNRVTTTTRFFATGYVGFIIVAFLLFMQNQINSAVSLLSLALLIGAYHIHQIYREVDFYNFLSEDSKDSYQLNKTKELLETKFEKLKNLRVASLGIFAVILPLMAIVLANASLELIATIFIFISLIGGLISELVGRYLFYVTAVPWGLAGNFFAGNQRG